MRGERIYNWLAYLFILFTVMYFGAHILAYIIYHQS
jgi:hypothetical protein